ncbi:hypothetical protein [Stomatohabitans albus]|uniref:hypothetical protein n=1 Tax=Stomatohabitans albus TaxID=3110766 RepID=UPI00300C1085
MSIAQTLAQHAIQPEVGEYNTFKFVQPGDQIAGVIESVRWDFKTQFEASADLIAIIDETDGIKKDVWVSTIQLKNGLKLQPVGPGGQPLGRPVQAGDQVLIRLDSITPLEGGKSMKNYSVGILPGNGQPPVYTPPSPQAGAPVASQPAYGQAPAQPSVTAQMGYTAPQTGAPVASQPAYGQLPAQPPAQPGMPGDGAIPF